MGVKRGTGKNSFIDSVLQTLDDFYANVVQHLREWQPPAPRLQKEATVESEEVQASLTADDPPTPAENVASTNDSLVGDFSTADPDPE